MTPDEPIQAGDNTNRREDAASAAPIVGATQTMTAEKQADGPTQAELEPYIQSLRATYERLRGEREAAESQGLHDNVLDSTGEIYAADNHPADIATDVFLRQRDMLLESNLDGILRQCERALEKVEEGTYGYSDVSGAFIGQDRLDAVPYATMTVEEQERVVEG